MQDFVISKVLSKNDVKNSTSIITKPLTQNEKASTRGLFLVRIFQ
jgi:hypothetical protein